MSDDDRLAVGVKAYFVPAPAPPCAAYDDDTYWSSFWPSYMVPPGLNGSLRGGFDGELPLFSICEPPARLN